MATDQQRQIDYDAQVNHILFSPNILAILTFVLFVPSLQ
jgi:hypothetical protein